MNEAPPFEALVVAEDESIAGPLEAVLRDEGATVHRAETVEAAVAISAHTSLDVAFVEVPLGLALCHHLPRVAGGVEIHAVVRPRDLERGAEAVSLGVAGVLVTPVTGDAIVRAVEARRMRRGEEASRAALLAELDAARRRLAIYDRLVRFARGAGPSDAVRAIVDGAMDLSGARGVALYATFGDKRAERVRLAAIGAATDMPATASPEALSGIVDARCARLVSLVAGTAEIGVLVLEGATEAEERVRGLSDLAAAMLSVVDRPVEPARAGGGAAPPLSAQRGNAAFRDVATRLLSLSARHGRRASLVAVHFAGAERAVRRERALASIADLVRETDAFATEEGDLVLFLPESGGLGAHACRRRVLARLSGERRARPPASSSSPRLASGPRSEPGAEPELVCAGVATFPHDGPSLDHLLRAARRRAVEDARSAVHALGLAALSLPEIVDELLARPILEAGPRSPYPLDLAEASLLGVVSRACRDALRTGQASIVTTARDGLGAATAARQVGGTSPRVVDVRGTPGCSDLEAVVVESEQGAWVCCGRTGDDRFRGVHAADPLLADLLVQRLVSAGAPA